MWALASARWVRPPRCDISRELKFFDLPYIQILKSLAIR